MLGPSQPPGRAPGMPPGQQPGYQVPTDQMRGLGVSGPQNGPGPVPGGVPQGGPGSFMRPPGPGSFNGPPGPAGSNGMTPPHAFSQSGPLKPPPYPLQAAGAGSNLGIPPAPFSTPGGSMQPPPPAPGSMPGGVVRHGAPPLPGGPVSAFRGPPGAPQMGAAPPPGPAVNMPYQVPPASTNSAMLAGIPPPGRPGMQPPPPMGMALQGSMSSMGALPLGMPPGPQYQPQGMQQHTRMGPPGGPPPPPMSGGGPPSSNGQHMPLPPSGFGPPPPPMSGSGQHLPPPGFGQGPPQGVVPGRPMQQVHPGHQQAAASNRIDPSQIPRPSIALSQTTVLETRAGGIHSVPPPAASRFVVKDRGSCGPRFMRSSLNQVPFTLDLLNNSSLPFCVAVSPMALQDPADDPVPLVDLGELGPVRCGRCKAYMNPYMRWTAGGRSFVCNFCGCSNQTPDAYFCPTSGHDGRRGDMMERPELCRGSVDIVATREYSIRPPMVPAHFFLVDVTQHALASGATATACSAISKALDHLPYPERTLVGIATFDSVLHFYSMRPSPAQPQMLVVTDVSDVFTPNSAPLLVPLEQHKTALQDLLNSLPNIWQSSRVTDSCGGAAVEAAVAVLQLGGGKVHAFLSVLPNTGQHALKMRDGSTMNDKDKLAYLASQDNTCKSLAMSAADFQVSVDVAFLAQGYVDVATLSDLVSSTGGTLYQYTPFNPVMDHDQVLNDLQWALVRPQALEAIMRVRCSQGLDVQSYTGHFYRQPNNPTDVYLPAVDSDKCILATLGITEKLQVNQECYLQAALLYTSPDGQRRVRVHTLALPITDSITSVFKAADLDTYTCHLSRKVASMLPGTTLTAARETVTSSVVATLAAYRKYCAANSSAVQLILPEALKLLPLHALALLKGPALKDGAKPDERSYWCTCMLSLPVARTTTLLYPRLLAVHSLLQQGGVAAAGGVPEGLVASSESLAQGGVYLLENGASAYLYVDKAVPQQVLQDLLGVSSYADLCNAPASFPLLPQDSDASRELQNLLNQVRVQRSSFMRLRVARKGDAAEVAFFNGLVEDRSTAGMSYVEYLCQVHKLIQNKLQ